LTADRREDSMVEHSGARSADYLVGHWADYWAAQRADLTAVGLAVLKAGRSVVSWVGHSVE